MLGLAFQVKSVGTNISRVCPKTAIRASVPEDIRDWVWEHEVWLIILPRDMFSNFMNSTLRFTRCGSYDADKLNNKWADITIGYSLVASRNLKLNLYFSTLTISLLFFPREVKVNVQVEIPQFLVWRTKASLIANLVSKKIYKNTTFHLRKWNFDWGDGKIAEMIRIWSLLYFFLHCVSSAAAGNNVIFFSVFLLLYKCSRFPAKETEKCEEEWSHPLPTTLIKRFKYAKKIIIERLAVYW